MRQYKTTVRLERQFIINAKDAADANLLLDEAVHRVEFDSGLTNDGYEEFEDDPVDCPKCNGDGMIGEQACDRCNGDGSIPFTAGAGGAR